MPVSVTGWAPLVLATLCWPLGRERITDSGLPTTGHRQPLLTTAYCSTKSLFSALIAPSTAVGCAGGTLSLFSVSTRCCADVFHCASTMSSPLAPVSCLAQGTATDLRARCPESRPRAAAVSASTCRLSLVKNLASDGSVANRVMKIVPNSGYRVILANCV